MKKPAHLWQKLLLFGLFGVVLLLWDHFSLPCVFRHFTGLPCLGCGMTRAWKAVCRLAFADAFRYHPMFWSVPFLAVYILYDGKPIARPRVNTCLLVILLAGLFLCYILRLVLFLNGSLTI